MIQQLADASQESNEMRPLSDGAGVGIAIGLEELREPDGGVDGQDASLEGFDGDAPADGQEETPEALDSHAYADDGYLLGADALPFGLKVDSLFPSLSFLVYDEPMSSMKLKRVLRSSGRLRWRFSAGSGCKVLKK